MKHLDGIMRVWYTTTLLTVTFAILDISSLGLCTLQAVLIDALGQQ